MMNNQCQRCTATALAHPKAAPAMTSKSRKNVAAATEPMVIRLSPVAVVGGGVAV
jgi:hypothetical protein